MDDGLSGLAPLVLFDVQQKRKAPPKSAASQKAAAAKVATPVRRSSRVRAKEGK